MLTISIIDHALVMDSTWTYINRLKLKMLNLTIRLHVIYYREPRPDGDWGRAASAPGRGPGFLFLHQGPTDVLACLPYTTLSSHIIMAQAPGTPDGTMRQSARHTSSMINNNERIEINDEALRALETYKKKDGSKGSVTWVSGSPTRLL